MKMKVLEMIETIEKYEMVENGIGGIRVNKKINDKDLIEKCKLNKNYILMLLDIKYRFDYLKDVLKTHSNKVSDKQVLYAIYLSEQDPYLCGMDRNFDNITQKEMQEMIRDFKNSCDRVIK